MRYLVHSANCTYDSTNGTFSVLLDRQIANPRTITVRQCNFIASTNTSYPPAVYLHSNALSRMISTKHMVQLKASNHEDSCNIVAVLDGSHTPGRYNLPHYEFFEIVPSRIERSLDFRFSDNGAILAYGGDSDPTVYDEVEDSMEDPGGQTKTGRIFRAYDTGGSGSNYGDNQNLNRIYTTTDGGNWKLTFLEFTSEATYDKLTIKEVNADDSETDLLTDHSGSLPDPATITSTRPTIKFYWVSDGSNNGIGWDAILWEDNDGANTLTEGGDGSYTLSVPAESAGDTGNKFVLELEIEADH